MESDLNSIIPLPLYNGKVVGFRFWNIEINSFGDPTLHAASNWYQWRSGENLADCDPKNLRLRHLDPSPGIHCQCGFNAWNSYSHDYIRRARLNSLNKDDPLTLVYGSIEGYGNLQIHEKGWRAEKAAVIGFVRPDRELFHANVLERLGATTDEIFDKLATSFEVPSFDSFEELYEYSRQDRIDLDEEPLFEEIEQHYKDESKIS